MSPIAAPGPAMVDTIAGNVPSMFDSLPSAAPHIKAGKVRALAVSGEERNPAFPDVPTMKEPGYPDLISYSWFGISVPAKTPQPIVDRLATRDAGRAEGAGRGQALGGDRRRSRAP